MRDSLYPGKQVTIQQKQACYKIGAIFSLMAIGFIICPVAAVGQGSEDASIEDIRDAWIRRESRVNSAKFVWQEEKLFPKGSLTGEVSVSRGGPKEPGEIPPNDVTADFQRSLTFDGRNFRYFVEGEPIWVSMRSEFAKTPSLQVWNGEVGKSLVTAPTEQQQGHLYASYEHILRQAELYPLLFHFRWRMLAQYFPLERFSIERRNVRIKKASCILLSDNTRSSGREKMSLWVDPAKEFSRVRQERRYNGNIVTQIEIDYVRKPGESWVPATWRASQFRESGKMESAVEARVIEYSLNVRVPPERFTLEFPEGALVYDHRKRGSDRYVARADQSLRPVSTEELRRVTDTQLHIDVQKLLESKPGQAGLEPVGSLWIVWLLTAAAMIIAAFGYKYWKSG